MGASSTSIALEVTTMLSSDTILELRGIRQQLQQITKDLGPETALSEVVGVGWELWRLIEMSHQRLNGLKDQLRKEAGNTPGRYTFKGPDGTKGMVQVQAPSPVQRSEADMAELQNLLGSSKFTSLFSISAKWKVRKDFDEAVSQLTPEETQALHQRVDFRASKPRATFMRKK